MVNGAFEMRVSSHRMEILHEGFPLTNTISQSNPRPIIDDIRHCFYALTLHHREVDQLSSIADPARQIWSCVSERRFYDTGLQEQLCEVLYKESDGPSETAFCFLIQSYI